VRKRFRINGQVVSHTGTPGVTASQEYAYDKAGRLVGVADTSARAVCTRRAYGFDKNSNRTSLTTVAGVRWITKNTTTGQVTRNVERPGGDLAATTTASGEGVLSLSTIHRRSSTERACDVVSQIWW
jgi:YD repeat-containing protein